MKKNVEQTSAFVLFFYGISRHVTSVNRKRQLCFEFINIIMILSDSQLFYLGMGEYR
jgi:hypothetical protein